MPDSAAEAAARCATSVTLPVDLLTEAQERGVDVSLVCEHALRTALAKVRAEQQWLEENREAIASYNEYVERNGLPWAEYRQLG